MKALAGSGRKEVIRAIVVVAVIACPLVGWAQFGSAAKAVQLSSAAAPASAEVLTPPKAAVATAAVATKESCANQHWPFFSAECLRGATPAATPRLVSMNVDNAPPQPAPKLATAASAQHVVRSTQDHAPSAKSRKPAKPRVAHIRARRPASVSLAANSDAAQISMPGW